MVLVQSNPLSFIYVLQQVLKNMCIYLKQKGAISLMQLFTIYLLTENKEQLRSLKLDLSSVSE